jgi:outer membrane lipoprotein SlyB
MLGCVPTTAKNDRAPVPFNGTHKRNTMNRTVNRRAATLAFALTLTFAQVAGAQSPAAPPSEPAAAAPARAKVACNECGVVRSVKLVEKKGSSSGVGAVAGGVLGGLLGHQIGSGRGNTAATIVGAGAGAYAGNEVEKNKKKQTYWSVSVKMDNGTTRSYTFSNKPEFRDGDRVKTFEDGRRLALLTN